MEESITDCVIRRVATRAGKNKIRLHLWGLLYALCPFPQHHGGWGVGGEPRWPPGVQSKVSSIIILLAPDFEIVYATLKRFAASA